MIDLEIRRALRSHPVDEDIALSLAREYARFLMGYRPKSPECKELTIMGNRIVRSETWRIVRRYGLARNDQPQWERYFEERGESYF